MKAADNIKEFVRNAAVKTSPEMDEAVFSKVLAAHEQTKNKKSALTPPILRRTIMKNPITKIAAAAAVIILVALGLLEFVGDGGTSGVVLADVTRKVQASRGVIFRTVRQDTPDPYGKGIDFSTVHYSSTRSRINGYEKGELVKTIYSVCDMKTVILVDYYHKSYVKDTDAEDMPKSFQAADPNSMIQRFLSCEHGDLGRKTIDGVLCEGFETTDPSFSDYDDPSEHLTARIWVSVETGYPVQIESEYIRHNGEIRFEIVADQFQWDVELDESLFEPDIPESYIDISPDEW